MNNRYLVKVVEMEKRAFLESLLAVPVVHGLQNIGMKGLLRNKNYAQHIADATRLGFEHGKEYHSVGTSLLAGVVGKEAVELPHLANKAAIGFRKYLDQKGHTPTIHDHLALRMVSQGRFRDLEKLHTRTKGQTSGVITHLHDYLNSSGHTEIASSLQKGLKHHEGVDAVSQMFKKPKGVFGSVKSDNYPILSNVSSTITRGKPMVSSTYRMSDLAERASTLALGVAEPAAGVFNATKQVLAHPIANKVPVITKVRNKILNHFKNTATESSVSGALSGGSKLADVALQMGKQEGIVPAGVKGVYHRGKNIFKGIFGNAISAELDRTGYALGKASTKGLG